LSYSNFQKTPLFHTKKNMLI